MNNQDKHTAGPWEVTDQNGDPEGSFRGVRRPTQTNSLGKPYNMYVAQYCLPEDARLIAAAPTMYAALKDIEGFLKRSGYDTRLVREVLAKATGIAP